MLPVVNNCCEGKLGYLFGNCLDHNTKQSLLSNLSSVRVILTHCHDSSQSPCEVHEE